MAKERVSVEIDATEKVSEAAKNAGNAIKGVETQTKSSTGAMAVAFAASQLAVDAFKNALKNLKQFVTESVDAFVEQERVLRRLEAAVKNNPLMDGSSAKNLADFASALQGVTTFGDELTQQQAVLLTSMGLTENQIKRVLTVAADLASSGLMDFGTAVDQLGRSLGGVGRSLGMVLPAIREMTEEQLKAGSAIDYVELKFAGMAKAATATLGGTRDQVKNLWGDFKELIGEALSPWVKELLTILKSALEGINKMGAALSSVGASFLSIIPGLNLLDAVRMKLNEIRQGAIDSGAAIKRMLEGDPTKSLLSASVAAEGFALQNLTKQNPEALKMFRQLEDLMSGLPQLLIAGTKPLGDTEKLLGIENLMTQFEKAGATATRMYSQMLIWQAELQTKVTAALTAAAAPKPATGGIIAAGAIPGFGGGQVNVMWPTVIADAIRQHFEPAIESFETAVTDWTKMRVGEQLTEFANDLEQALSEPRFMPEGSVPEAVSSDADAMLAGAFSAAATGAASFALKVGQAAAEGGAMAALMVLLEPVFYGLFQVLGPAIDGILKPLIGFLAIFGGILGQVLVPVLAALKPLFDVFLNVFVGLFNVFLPVIQLVANAFGVLGVILDAVSRPFEFVGDLLTWVGKGLKYLGSVLAHPLDKSKWDAPPGAFSSDAFQRPVATFTPIVLEPIDLNDLSAAGDDFLGSSGYSDQQTTVQRPPDINIYLTIQGNVIGAGGPTEVGEAMARALEAYAGIGGRINIEEAVR